MKCVCTCRLMYYLGQSDHRNSLNTNQNATLASGENRMGAKRAMFLPELISHCLFSTDCVNMVKDPVFPQEANK